MTPTDGTTSQPEAVPSPYTPTDPQTLHALRSEAASRLEGRAQDDTDVDAADRPEPLAPSAATPDTYPEDLPALTHDLPPSYPPLRRPTDPHGPGSQQASAAAQRGATKRRRLPGSTLLVVILAVVVTALVKSFVVQWFEIPSSSMADTLTVGDRVAVTMYDSDTIARGDIVVFRDPDNWLSVTDPSGLRGVVRDTLILIRLLPEDSGHHLIKRVIGLPGDHIVADGTGPLTVNGVAIDEPYLRQGVSASTMAFDVTVPSGCVWVMGDNRANSADSRYHQDDAHAGFVPEEDIVGVAKAIVWPVGHWAQLDSGKKAFAEVPDPATTAPAPAEPLPEDGA